MSAAAVSAIVGYTLPAATSFSHRIAASPLNDEVSAEQTICTFGPENSIPELKKTVSLSIETVSKPLTAAEVLADLKKTSSTQLKVSASIDSALGGQVVAFSESGGGLVGSGLALINGTTEYGASVEQATTNAKLAALLKLAEQL